MDYRVLKEPLKAFVDEALEILKPAAARPASLLDTLNPLVQIQTESLADAVMMGFPSGLDKLESHKTLHWKVIQGELQAALHNIGYQWIWHVEVLPELFLAQLIRRSGGLPISAALFNQVFAALLHELETDSLTLRKVTAVCGFPRLARPVRFGKSVSLLPFGFQSAHANLWVILRCKYQRSVDRYLSVSQGLFLVEDVVVPKRDEGRPLLDELQKRPENTRRLLGALRLASPGTIHVAATFYGHLSNFPLIPLERHDNEEARLTHYGRGEVLGPKERRRLFRAVQLVTSEGSRQPEFRKFLTAFDRFNSSFRLTKHAENIIDSVVALEGLYDVRSEELRRRLALRVSVLLARSENESRVVYEHIQAAYTMRNTLVHGRGSLEDIQRDLRKAAERILPKSDRLDDDFDELLLRASGSIREYVRRSLWAFARLQGFLGESPSWPVSEEEWDRPLFDTKRRRDLSNRVLNDW